MLDRRRLLALGAGLGVGSPALAQEANRPSPTFAGEPTFVAGLRPQRSDGYRLEVDRQLYSGKRVVHNYGHGGGGITLSWGCAAFVRDRVVELSPVGTPVAVLGSGVMGLTAAVMLADAGYRPTIYTERPYNQTTSAVAGGQWAPSDLEMPDTPAYRKVLQDSYDKFRSLPPRYGVKEMLNFTLRQPCDRAGSALRWVEAVDPSKAPVYYRRLPFEGVGVGGWAFPTLLCPPPKLLPELAADLRGRARIVIRPRFTDLAQLADLSEPVIVNCLGLGSRGLFPDSVRMVGMKGQLALLPAQRNLDYLFGGLGYVFPRDDHVVVGGSFTRYTMNEDEDLRPNPDEIRLIIRVVRALFEGVITPPAWLSGSDYLRNRLPLTRAFTDAQTMCIGGSAVL